jgi:hypothetical protein
MSGTVILETVTWFSKYEVEKIETFKQIVTICECTWKVVGSFQVCSACVGVVVGLWCKYLDNSALNIRRAEPQRDRHAQRKKNLQRQAYSTQST